ncbi:hypothetical protein GCM10027203_24940 [Nonomuraea fastidiosa]
MTIGAKIKVSQSASTGKFIGGSFLWPHSSGHANGGRTGRPEPWRAPLCGTRPGTPPGACARTRGTWRTAPASAAGEPRPRTTPAEAGRDGRAVDEKPAVFAGRQRERPCGG